MNYALWTIKISVVILGKKMTLFFHKKYSGEDINFYCEAEKISGKK